MAGFDLQCVQGDEALAVRLGDEVTRAFDRVLYGPQHRKSANTYSPLKWLEQPADSTETELTNRGITKVNAIVRHALDKEVTCLNCTHDNSERTKIYAEIEEGITKIIAAIRTAILAVDEFHTLATMEKQLAKGTETASSNIVDGIKKSRQKSEAVVAEERRRIYNVIHSLFVNVRNSAGKCEATQRLRASTHENLHDDLLKELLNRKGLEAYYDHLQEICTTNASHPRQEYAHLLEHGLIVLAIDIDHFKFVNDTYGHPKGDIILKDVAQRMQEISRSGDAVARIGGDEFLVLYPGASYEIGMRRAETLRGMIWEYGRTPHPDLQFTPGITGSFGLLHLDAETIKKTGLAAIKEAVDVKLYDAKGKEDGSGRNRVTGGILRNNVFQLKASASN